MTQELDTNKHRVIYCVKFLKSIYIPNVITVWSCTLGKNKKATFF